MIAKNFLLQRVGRALLASSLVLGAGVLVSASSPTAEAAVPEIKKIAVVDMQRVLNETKAGKAARKKLEGASKSKQAKLDKRRRKLEADQAKLANLKGQQLAAAQEKLQREAYELQNIYMTLQQELMNQEAKMLEDMFKNCQKLSAEMARDLSVDLVLVKDQATVLYTHTSVDLTGDLIKRYDKKHAAGRKK
jgi:outer membrane protein